MKYQLCLCHGIDSSYASIIVFLSESLLLAGNHSHINHLLTPPRCNAIQPIPYAPYEHPVISSQDVRFFRASKINKGLCKTQGTIHMLEFNEKCYHTHSSHRSQRIRANRSPYCFHTSWRKTFLLCANALDLQFFSPIVWINCS